MIFDIINQKVSDMRDLRRRETTKANETQQLVTDAKYHTLVEQVKKFSEALSYIRDNLCFVVTDALQKEFLILLKKLKDVTNTGNANRETLSEAETDFKSIQETVKNEWTKHFSAYTATKTNTLRVISGIDLDRVSRCIDEIEAAETWSLDFAVFVTLKKAMESAESLIQSLDMDQETELFLTKMSSGKATIVDLNEKVLLWIRKESLESKIKLSFISK